MGESQSSPKVIKAFTERGFRKVHPLDGTRFFLALYYTDVDGTAGRLSAVGLALSTHREGVARRTDIKKVMVSRFGSNVVLKKCKL